MFGTADMGKQGELLNKVADLIDAGEIKTTMGQHYGIISAKLANGKEYSANCTML